MPLDGPFRQVSADIDALTRLKEYNGAEALEDNTSDPAEIGSPADVEETKGRVEDLVKEIRAITGESMPVETVKVLVMEFVMKEREKAADTAEYLLKEKHQIVEETGND